MINTSNVMTDMKILRFHKNKIALFFVIISIIYIAVNSKKLMEKFTNEAPMSSTLANAHGSKPVGLGASPGKPQQQQNADAAHVNPMYKNGNPQNTNPGLKLQP